MLALAGFQLDLLPIAGHPDAYLVSRWNWSRELPDLAAVERLAERVALPAAMQAQPAMTSLAVEVPHV